MHEENSFVTLTYQTMPENGSISVRHLQLFLKRLRKKYGPHIRFFACGEYGDKLDRPHYHLCLFGHDFHDKYLWKITEQDDKLYRSPELEKIWTLGFSTIGSVTFKSAAYVARYQLKKINGPTAAKHYQGKTPEFLTMSRGGNTGLGGIGSQWLKKYETDVYPGDFLIINQKKARPPRFYDQKIDDEKLRHLKWARKKGLRKHEKDNTPERLAVRERIQNKKLDLLKRKI